MKIGIPANINLLATDNFNLDKANYTNEFFIDLLVKHGIRPEIIPLVPKQMVQEYVAEVDGIIIPGGNDVDPEMFAEKPEAEIGKTYQPHDEFEVQIVKEAIKNKIPVLGICRGHQIINVAMGGTLYQDLATDLTSVEQHDQTVPNEIGTQMVAIKPDSQLAQTVGTNPMVNSKHHQAIKKVGSGLKVNAVYEDGVIEGIENADGSITGVQWHPELMWHRDKNEEKIFTDFFARVKAAE